MADNKKLKPVSYGRKFVKKAGMFVEYKNYNKPKQPDKVIWKNENIDCSDPSCDICYPEEQS